MTKKQAPAILLFIEDLDQFFSGEDALKDAELGEVMKAVWECHKGKNPNSVTFDSVDQRRFFRSAIKNIRTGQERYEKRVVNAGLGGIMGKLAELPGYDLHTVKEIVKQKQEEGYIEEDIISHLKEEYRRLADLNKKGITEGKASEQSYALIKRKWGD